MISIIVPVYNVEKFLEKCVKSITESTYKDFELLLIDDGSTDSSAELCDKFAGEDSRIVVVHKKNGGLSSARNVGLEKMKGDFVVFVDSDDYLNCNSIELLYDNIVSSGSDIVISGTTWVDEQGVIIKEVLDKATILDRNELKDEDFMRAYMLKFKNTVSAWAKIYKKDIFRDLRYKEGALYEDGFMVPQLIGKASKISFIPDATYNYLQRRNSIVHVVPTEKHLDNIEARLTWLILFFERKYGVELLQFAANEVHVRIVHYARWKEIKASERYKSLVRQYIQYEKKITLRKYGLKNWIVYPSCQSAKKFLQRIAFKVNKMLKKFKP